LSFGDAAAADFEFYADTLRLLQCGAQWLAGEIGDQNSAGSIEDDGARRR
jgi:hypothetical protein